MEYCYQKKMRKMERMWVVREYRDSGSLSSFPVVLEVVQYRNRLAPEDGRATQVVEAAKMTSASRFQMAGISFTTNLNISGRPIRQTNSDFKFVIPRDITCFE